MKKELMLGAALALGACNNDQQLQGVTPVDCWDNVTNNVVDINITAKPTDRPDFSNGEFSELWETKGNTANRVEQLVALASLPQIDGDYNEYHEDDVEVLPELDDVDLGGEDIDYAVGFMTDLYLGDEAALDGTWVNIAIVDRTCDSLKGWGKFSIGCADSNPDCRPEYQVSRVAFLDYNGQMRY